MITMKLFPDQPFAEIEEFLGTLTLGDLVVPDLHCVVQFNQAHNDAIKGKILGNSSTYDRVANLFLMQGPPLKLSSVSATELATRYTSDELYFERIARPYAGLDRSPEAVGVVAEFHLGDFSMTTQRAAMETKQRKVTFLLTGPTVAWDAKCAAMNSRTGEREIVYSNRKLELQDQTTFEIETLPWFFHATSRDPQIHSLETQVLSVQFTTLVAASVMSDEQLVDQARSIMDDLVLLASFVSRRWTAWYAFLIETPTIVRWHLKRTRECSAKEPKHHETVLPPGTMRSFLAKAFPLLRSLRAQDFNLAMPIVYSVAGSEARYDEEQFTSLFLSLERIKDLFARSDRSYAKVLDDTDFFSLSRNICQLVRQSVSSKARRKLIYEKLPEINRPSLRSVLDALLQKQVIKWTDLYPANAKFSLIKTRDKLFHSSESVDHDQLIHELDRLRALVDRLLLSLLGSRDFSRAPIDFIRDQITSPSQNGNAA